ncbi:MAG: DoxX family protein [Steroidobacteraceae bacterium]
MHRIFARRVSVRIYGLAAVVLGLEGIVWGDFAVVWQAAPNGVPARTALRYAVAVAPLLAGLAIQWQRAAARGTLALTVFYGLGVLLLDVPRLIAHPSAFINWYGVAEPLALAAGGLAAYAYCAQLKPAAAERLVKIGRLIFGACLIVFGLAHLFYLAHTAELVPAWLPPGQKFWVYATAVGHGAAGVAILSGICARAAAMLLTAMFVVFGILVHAPTIFIDPHAHFNWAENAINFALIGSAWVMAANVAESHA